jgi:aminopeptidase-like protein
LGGYEAVRAAIECVERNRIPRLTVLCEPQLGKRGLYPTTSTKNSWDEVRTLLNFVAYCDGKKDLLDIAETIGAPIWNLYDYYDRLVKEKLIEEVN